MSLVALEQALLESKWGTAEIDAVEVVARMLSLPREAVVRVEFALEAARNAGLGRVEPNEHEIPDDVQAAMKTQVRRGLHRVRVREAIRDDALMYAPVSRLVTEAKNVCRGCQFSIDCVVKNHSTPAQCFKSGPPMRIKPLEDGRYQITRLSRGGTPVTPLRIRGDRVSVTCEHPKGSFDLDVGDVWPV